MSSINQSTDHMIQICRERSARGVATRADWERLHAQNPDRALQELRSFLATEQPVGRDPFDASTPAKRGVFFGFLFGVLFMSAWWLFGDYLHREVVTSGKQWDIVTLTQYIAASLIPVFAWLGWRWDQRKNAKAPAAEPGDDIRSMDWEQLLQRFDAGRKAGGTRMY